MSSHRKKVTETIHVDPTDVTHSAESERPAATVETASGDTTEVHVNVDETESKWSKFRTWLVGVLGAASALVAGAGSVMVGQSSSNTANALGDLAESSEQRTQIESAFSHQEQVLPVRLAVSEPQTRAQRSDIPEGYELITLTLSNPGDTVLMDTMVHLPKGTIAKVGNRPERTNHLEAGVIAAGGEVSRSVLVPASTDGIAAQFTTSWDPRERWLLEPEVTPAFQSCVFNGGDSGRTTVELADTDLADSEWLGCDLVYDESGIGEGSLDKVADLADTGKLKEKAAGKAGELAGNGKGKDGDDNGADAADSTPHRSRVAIADPVDFGEPESSPIGDEELATLFPQGNPL